MAATDVFDRLLQIAMLFEQDLEASFAGTDLTTARTHLLWELSRRGPSTQQLLARALDVSPRNITGLVDALERAGYVERRAHPGDRRAVLVTLTDLGVETMDGMARDRELISRQLLTGFSGDRVAELGRDLGVIAERLEIMINSARSTGDSSP